MYGVERYAAVRLPVAEEGLSHHEAAEAFVPLHHPRGYAQVDFGKAVAEVGGEQQASLALSVHSLLEVGGDAIRDALRRRFGQ